MSFPKIEKMVVSITNKVFGREISYNLLPESLVLEIKGVFDKAYIEYDGVSTTRPVLTIDLALIGRYPSKKDTILIDSVLYKIIDIRQDQFGGALLVLSK